MIGEVKKSSALFLDRDGVINIDYGYVSTSERFDLMPDTDLIIKRAMERGYVIIVITNQAGIGRGLYTECDFHHLTKYMLEQLDRRGCRIDAVYHCPFHPTEGVGKYLRDSFDRKPNPGMLLKAMEQYHIDMSSSVLIGDKISDIHAGLAASVYKNLLYNPSGNATPLPEGCVEIKYMKQALEFL